MSKYIDIEEVTRTIFKRAVESTMDLNTVGDIINIIQDFPTADVVEVIPCKNCFYSKPYNAVWHLPLEENNLWCSRYKEEKENDWFCADAIERTVKK